MKKEDLSSYMIKGTEWFARLAILNLVWLLFSLPIVTAVPAFYAMFYVLNNWMEGNTQIPIFGTFKSAFTSHFGKSYKMSIPFLVVGLIVGVNLFFFFTQSIPSNWFYILKYANYLIAILYVLLLFYYVALNQLVNFKISKMTAISFVIAASQPWVAFLLLLIVVLLFLAFHFLPGFILFFSMSVPGLAFMKAARRGYSKLLEKTSKNQDN